MRWILITKHQKWGTTPKHFFFVLMFLGKQFFFSFPSFFTSVHAILTKLIGCMEKTLMIIVFQHNNFYLFFYKSLELIHQCELFVPLNCTQLCIPLQGLSLWSEAGSGAYKSKYTLQPQLTLNSVYMAMDFVVNIGLKVCGQKKYFYVLFGKSSRIQIKIHPQTPIEPKHVAFYFNNKVSV